MNQKQGTIVSAIWLLPTYRESGMITIGDYRLSTAGKTANPIYGRGSINGWNFGLMCLGKIAKEANCDLVLWTDPYTEHILRMEENQFISDPHRVFPTVDCRLSVQEVWNTAKIKYYDLDSSALIPHERFLQKQHNTGIFNTAICAREVQTPYYTIVTCEKPNLLLDSALECNTDQVYWIDTAMWTSNATSGGLQSGKSVDDILQIASGSYYTNMHDTMINRPGECLFMWSGGRIAAGLFGGTREGVVAAMSVYKEHFPNYVSSVCNDNLLYDHPNSNVNEQKFLTDLYSEGLLPNSFIAVDTGNYDTANWPALMKRTHEDSTK